MKWCRKMNELCMIIVLVDDDIPKQDKRCTARS